MRAFLDSSTIIYAFEFPDSNSALVFDIALDKSIDAIISPKVLTEVKKYFRERKGKDYASLIEFILKSNFIIATIDIASEMKKLEDKVKKKDIEQVAVVKKLNIPYLVAFDRDFKVLHEYKTPRDFVKLLGLKVKKMEY